MQILHKEIQNEIPRFQVNSQSLLVFDLMWSILRSILKASVSHM